MTSQFTRIYTIVEAVEILMNDWSDDEDNLVDIVTLPPDKVHSMTDLPSDDNQENFGSVLPKDLTGPIAIHSNTALTDVESTKPNNSEPTDKEHKLSLGNKKSII